MASGSPTPFLPGARLVDGSDLNAAIAAGPMAWQNALTAKASGGRPGATALIKGINQVGTVASSGDSVLLPACVPGDIAIVQNVGANAMQIFATGSDTIAGTAGSTGISAAAASKRLFYCAIAGRWDFILSA